MPTVQKTEIPVKCKPCADILPPPLNGTPVVTFESLSADARNEKLYELAELFRTNIAQYKSPNYDESNTRTDFIDKFFELVGWDVRNTQGHAEQYRDVVREDKVVVDNRPKAPDYSFRIGGYRKFFVEAKKPSVNIHDDISPAFQIRRYGYTAKLALSILTDFEEFAVYDTRIKPHKNDKASKGRIFYCRYDQYLEKCDFEGVETNFDYIIGTFSKTAILKGSFDRYIESTKNRKGTGEVDKELLALVEQWRLDLAKNVAKANPKLDTHNLNVAVQRIIDRILFLRIAEDRQIERYENLLHAAEKQGIYTNLHSLFVKADEKYNAGLFKQEGWLDGISVDDKVLAPIIKGLYYPESPYEFSVLPIEILGSIYERFLGKTIRLTQGHQAKVEEKPEVRKAGGVYYTPQYIVDYIVRETIGRKVAGKKPQVVEKLSVLDPACGSGSFLVGAYTFLLDWHRSYYEEESNRKAALKKGLIYEAGENTYRLSIETKQRILLNNIYGVDIDPIAVEVTKLSLYLKLLENETEESRGMLFSHSDLKMLPNLDANIQCGNSLIESDFYKGRQMNLFDDEAMRKVNAFDWQKAFPTIFNTGGFDCVIGNPPYVRIQQMKESAPEHVEYYKLQYQAASEGNYDLYTVFIEKGLTLLNGDGCLGIICPNKFFTAQYGRPIRRILSAGKHLSQIVNFGHHQVFENATTYTALLFLDKSSCEELAYTKVLDLDSWKTEHGLTTQIPPKIKGKTKKPSTTPTPEPIFVASEIGTISSKKITDDVWNFSVGKGVGLFEKLSQMPLKLGDIASIFVGLQTSADTVFLFKDSVLSKRKTTRLFSKELECEFEIENKILKPVIRSGSIGQYWATPTALALFPYHIHDTSAVLIAEDEMKEKFPCAWEYLVQNKKLLSNREHGKFKGKGWYQYGRNQSLYQWFATKIMLPYMVTGLSAYYDTQGSFFVNVTTGGFGMRIPVKYGDLRYFTSLLNSKLLDWYLKRIASVFRGGYFGANKQYLVQLPLPAMDLANKPMRTKHDHLVDLVSQMSIARVARQEAVSDSDRKLNDQRISILDREIDALVYELYGLTDEEIRIVEGSL